MDNSIYGWPNLLPSGANADPEDMAFASWGYKVRDELTYVYDFMSKPMPDDPKLLDAMVTQDIDGWLPRVASLAVKAEYFRNEAKARLWPSQISEDGQKITVVEREILHDTRLAPYTFMRDELDSLVHRLVDRVRWAQSVRKAQSDANL